MSSVLLLDISRLVWRARRKAPTGIDRVELAYAQHYIAGQDERPVHAVIHLCGFLFAVSRAGGQRFLAELAGHWEGSALSNRPGKLRTLLRIYWQLFTSGCLNSDFAA